MNKEYIERKKIKLLLKFIIESIVFILTLKLVIFIKTISMLIGEKHYLPNMQI